MTKNYRQTRRTILWALCAAAVIAPLSSWAQSATPLPGGPIKLVVGYAPGGPVDSAARLFAPHFARELGQTVIVENRPGAAGALGGDWVAKSQPQAGLLFFAASPTVTITPHLLKAMPFDPVKDIAAIAPVVAYANVLVINKDQPFKTVPELVAYAKANPGKITYGSAGVGASNHLSGELLALRTGTQMTHVPYKGNAPAMTDVIGGQINMMFDIIGTARNYIASGRVRAVAVTSRDRNTGLPDVPSMREAGVADYEMGGWFGIYGPASLPADLIARYNEATRKALATEELKSKLVEQGYDIWSGSPQVLSERAAKELALWAPVTKNIPAQ